jgi:hypothetical protein
MSELAYKFTRAGARSPFTGFAWPQDEWVEAEGDVALRANGIHACRSDALPRWLDDELWRIELEEIREEHDGVVVARRGAPARADRRLGCTPHASSCAVRAKQLAEDYSDPLIRKMADDIGGIAEGPDPSATALSMYCTAHAADVAVAGGYDAERRRQAQWLRERLQLDPQ